MQVGYEKFWMRVHQGKGSLLVTIPYMLCRREKIRAGDMVVFDRPEGKKVYSFYKYAEPKKRVASQRDETRC